MGNGLETKQKHATLKKIQEAMAKKFGIKRLGALKTANIGDGDIKKYVEFAREVEVLAKAMSYTALEKAARKHKIAMKNAYQEYQQNTADKTLDDYAKMQYREGCNLKIAAEAISLINIVLIRAGKMVEIYDKARNFKKDVKLSTENITAEALAGANAVTSNAKSWGT